MSNLSAVVDGFVVLERDGVVYKVAIQDFYDWLTTPPKPEMRTLLAAATLRWALSLGSRKK